MKAMRQFKHDLTLQTLQPLQRQLSDLHQVINQPPPYWNELIAHLKNGHINGKGEDRHLTMRDFKIAAAALTVGVPLGIWIAVNVLR
jgi:hypothetical protein